VTDIIDLRETSPGHWQAKYQGNYGIYTIRISTSEGKTTGFSCSCPSDRYPCKHIAIIESAIAERIAKNTQLMKKAAVSAEKLLKMLTREELYEFIARIIQYNPDLTNAVLLEFSHKIEIAHQNKYSLILRRALEEIDIEGDDYDEEDWLSIDVLDQWLEKADDCFKQGNYQDAVLIAQACIEEFAYWMEHSESGRDELVHEGYQTDPFDIFVRVVKARKINVRELFDYCMEELPKKKYTGTLMHDWFNDLLLELLKSGNEELNAGAFITLQNTLLEAVEDKRSGEAKKIVQRKINYYESTHDDKKAWETVEENLQIPAFRKKLTEKKIEEQDYGSAKKLVHDFLDENAGTVRHPSEWDDLLLTIAQKENDVLTLRDISRLCIDEYFKAHYFDLYKSTFTANEWADAREDLIAHYDKQRKGFNTSLADAMAAEKLAERLLSYIEKYSSIERLDKYHPVFAETFPEKTLALFREALDYYAENNMGRASYEHIAGVFRTMTRIPNGGAVVAEMIAEYRIRYKKRRAMIEILDRAAKNRTMF
jgi:hypothetical protein